MLFGFNRSDLTPTARSTAADIASAVERTNGRRISVEGHTDSVGSAEYNDRLSHNRAASVARELEKDGVPGNNISVRAYGKSKPIASNDTEEGRARNRRVEVIIEN